MQQQSKQRKPGPVTVAMLGCGARGEEYAKLIAKMPEKMKIVSVVSRNPDHRHAMGDEFKVPQENRFASHDELAAHPGIAEGVINSTSDAMHYPSSKPLLTAGFHMLLEKPITRHEPELRDLIDTAKKHDRIVLICHGMRYNPKYAKVKELVSSGAIGRVMTMRAVENIAYFHLATSLIRHPRNGPTNTPLLLYKCCHDLDMLAWMVAPSRAVRVSSLATPSQFYPKNAPAGSAKRCLDGCKIEDKCQYSARKIYTEENEWTDSVFPAADYHGKVPSLQEKLEILKTTSPYGRCTWHCEHSAVDHQGVLVEFANGVTATFDMVCGTPRGSRTMHILGSEGEIELDTVGEKLVLRRPAGNTAMKEEPIEFQKSHGSVTGHWLAEWRMLEDFASTVAAGHAGFGTTRIEDSLTGHQIAYAAEVSMREGRTVTVAQ